MCTAGSPPSPEFRMLIHIETNPLLSFKISQVSRFISRMNVVLIPNPCIIHNTRSSQCSKITYLTKYILCKWLPMQKIHLLPTNWNPHQSNFTVKSGKSPLLRFTGVYKILLVTRDDNFDSIYCYFPYPVICHFLNKIH